MRSTTLELAGPNNTQSDLKRSYMPRKAGRAVWLLALGLLVLAAAGYRLWKPFHGGPAAINVHFLRLERSGAELFLSCEPESAGIRAIRQASLEIHDGAERRTLRLPPEQITGTTISYSPKSAKVTFQVEVRDAQDHIYRESVIYLAGAPAPEPPAAESANLEVETSQESWMSVTAGTHTLYEGVLPADSFKSLPVEGAVRVTVGNAAGVQIRWEGEPAGRLGPPGQVRVVELRPGEKPTIHRLGSAK